MRILLVEDSQDKAESIERVVRSKIPAQELQLERASTVNDALVTLGGDRFDLVIVDLVLPQMKGEEARDATDQWCGLIEGHLSGKTASWIVMTGFPDIAQQARESFARHNVAVIQFDETCFWEGVLSEKLSDTYEIRPLDFVIVCALDKERRGYAHAPCEIREREVIVGLDCERIQIGDLRGVIVVQPTPGMIDAAITAYKALMTFRPRALAMSGICGGRENETEMGALVVPDISWNYQSGKFKEGKLTPDLVQVQIPPGSRAVLCQMLDETHSKELREGLMHAELSSAPLQMQAMVSGSQVVADKAVGVLIGEQGRKVVGIDMEVASVFFAARDFYNGGGIYCAAKTVVDLADTQKDDRYHEYGCALSARFIVKALTKLLVEQ